MIVIDCEIEDFVTLFNGESVALSGPQGSSWLLEDNGIIRATKPPVYFCSQCQKDMGNEWILGPVCGKCCRSNHRRCAR